MRGSTSAFTCAPLTRSDTCMTPFPKWHSLVQSMVGNGFEARRNFIVQTRVDDGARENPRSKPFVSLDHSEKIDLVDIA